MADLFGGDSGADFSPCGLYRWRLWRRWSDGPLLGFGLLNPSRAGVVDNDPTVSRLVVRGKRLGFGGLELFNDFGLISTDPKGLRSAPDPIGPENDRYILEIASRVEMIIVGWGAHAAFMNRGRAVAAKLAAAGPGGHRNARLALERTT